MILWSGLSCLAFFPFVISFLVLYHNLPGRGENVVVAVVVHLRLVVPFLCFLSFLFVDVLHGPGKRDVHIFSLFLLSVVGGVLPFRASVAMRACITWLVSAPFIISSPKVEDQKRNGEERRHLLTLPSPFKPVNQINHLNQMKQIKQKPNASSADAASSPLPHPPLPHPNPPPKAPA